MDEANFALPSREVAPSSDTLERALRLQQQLRRIFEANVGGTKDLSALQRVRDLCIEVSETVPDVLCRDRLGQLRNFADALFADRRYQRWARSRKNASLWSLRGRVKAALNDLDGRLRAIRAHVSR